MTDRPFPGGTGTAFGPAPGYYPDPSVPGFIRYWGGTAWVPGTTRPAPAPGELLEPPRFTARQAASQLAAPPAPPAYVPPAYVPAPYVPPAYVPPAYVPPPVVAAPATSSGDTGPLYFDQTTGGVSFTVASEQQAELELWRRGELEAVAAPEPVAESAAFVLPRIEPVPDPQPDASVPPDGPSSAASGWRADPRAQPGLLETGGGAEVSWGVQARTEVPAASVPASVPEPREPSPAPAAPAAPVALVVRGARRSAAPAPAGLGARLVARLLDTLIVAVVAVAAGVSLGAATVSHVQDKLDQARMTASMTGRQVQVWIVDPMVLGNAAALLAVLVLLGFLCEVLPTSRTGQTFGKRLVRIRVVAAGESGGRSPVPPSLGRATVRWVVGQLSLLLLVGPLWLLFDRRSRRGLQDRAARTRVVRGGAKA